MAELAGMAQVICLTGRDDEAWMIEQVRRLAPELSARVRVFGYLEDELADALVAADVVVARAGAATLGELPALGLPAILVPYPHAGKHQDRNAQFLVARGAAEKVDDATLSQDLVPALKRFFDEPEKAKTMSAASRALAQPQAATRLAALLASVEAHL
jgi:UDP-N-acetylglucosamine--N-acetylmuramyl-(pentapeptide) pyrophosphoryl-undecaprenol N-acetylglucosamine transferase